VFRSRTRILALVASLMMAMGLQLVSALPASAAALTNVSWNISKPLPGDTSARYTWLFTAATTGTVATTTFTVPSGTAGASLTVTDVSGLPSGGTATLSGTTVTYTATATSVAAGTKCLIAIDGFTNTATPGTYTSQVTTNTSVPAVIDGPTTSGNSQILASNTTAVSVVIARSSTFADNLNSFQLLMDPSLAANGDQSSAVETLTIKSNAANGYQLNIKETALTDGLGHTIANLTSGMATATTTFTADKTGYNVTKTGVGTLGGALGTASSYAGYTTAGENFLTSTGPTNADTASVTHRVKIDYGQGAGTYTATVTYTLGETY
jgi:hypothetical protein